MYYLAGVILSVTAILSACGEGTPTECTISTARDLRQGIKKVAKFAPNTDCEAMRTLAEEGKPLPTIADATTTTAAPKVAETTAQQAFKTPFVGGAKAPDLSPVTDKQARVQELEKKIGVDAKQSRDPFTSTIINPVPKLETLLAKPKEPPKLKAAVVVRTSTIKKVIAPPPPPDTRAAEGTKVTGTIEISGKLFAILTPAVDPTSRDVPTSLYVQAGQLISNGRVLVKRIDTNSEPPIVVLQQNGVEVFRAVGQVVAASTDNTQSTTTTTTQSTETLRTIPNALPPQ
jgi:hypothetical protein